MGWVFINDHFIPSAEAALGISDLSISRGYGIFDFLKVSEGHALFLNDHLDRLYASAEAMHLKIRMNRADLENLIHELIVRNNRAFCGVRITVTGGYSADGYHLQQPNLIISTHEISLPGDQEIEKGIVLLSQEFRRQFPAVKTIDYLMAIWLQPKLKAAGADDVLYHHQGLVSECPRANIFMVDSNNRIYTPSRNILKGITRKQILSFSSADMVIEERDISLEELYEAREVFICSTTKNILPVRQIDGRDLPACRPVTLKLLGLLRTLPALSPCHTPGPTPYP